MTAETNIVVDGQLYEVGQEIWDLGSFERGSDGIYQGQSADVAKLPHYVESGTKALCLDTGDIYSFHKSDDEWKLMQ